MCRLIRLLYALVPITRFRALLVRSHLAACQACSPDSGERGRWDALVRPPGWISQEAGYWPDIRARMQAGPGEARPRPAAAGVRPRSGLAVAAGGVLALAVLAVLVGRRPSPGRPPATAGLPGAPRIEILSAEVRGLPARTSVYQMKSASFIWFYPSDRKE
jgi:hypothetical protein